jgi:hypothetical protein
MPDLYRVETRAGTPILVNGFRLLPFVKSLSLSLPLIHFGLVWNRPYSILVIRPDGEEEILPIRDPTRQILWSLYGAIAVLVTLTAVAELRKRGTDELNG